MSFNRAQFLAPVLSSLKAQSPHGVAGREVHLFQDGAVNRYSRLRYATDDEIDECVALFEREFPDGVVHRSLDNIGICENFRRAEQYTFAERKFECAWFFEDDLVLSPVYFRMMEHLQNLAESVDNLGYFAVYGNHYVQRDEIAQRRHELTALDHHWGFGLTRRHWRALQPHLAAFYEVVVGTDYSRRDHRRIFEIYRSSSGSPRASSQDAAKAFACDQLGLWRCNTVVPFAKYIGTSGQHMTPEKFKDLGFDNTVIAQEPILNLDLPGPSNIRERVLEQRTLFEAVRRLEFDDIIAALPARQLNPMRPSTPEDIRAAHRLLLRRKVDDHEVFEKSIRRQPVQLLVADMLASPEFLKLTDLHAEVLTFKDAGSRGFCSAADVHALYGLLFHREPAPDNVDAYENKTCVDLLVQGILRSDEFRSLNRKFEM